MQTRDARVGPAREEIHKCEIHLGACPARSTGKRQEVPGFSGGCALQYCADLGWGTGNFSLSGIAAYRCVGWQQCRFNESFRLHAGQHASVDQGIATADETVKVLMGATQNGIHPMSFHEIPEAL